MKTQTKVETPKVLFLDEIAWETIQDDIKLLESSAREIADIWSQNELPKLNQDHFQKLLAGGANYLDRLLDQTVKSNMGKAGKFLNLSLEPDYSPHDREFFNRTCSYSARSRYVSMSIFNFDEKGQPYVSDKTKESIKAKTTAFGTTDNIRLYDAIVNAETALNELYAVLRTQGWRRLVPLQDDLIQVDGQGGVVISRQVLTFGKL